MDVEPFTSESFNPTTYLNQLLPPSNPDTYYASTTSLLPSLELLARNTRTDLDTALSTLLRNSTRLGIDMDTLTHDTRTLESQISRIDADVAGLQLESGVMSELSLLEVVQERMQQTLDTFISAGQWTTQLDETIRFQIDSGAFEAAEQRLAELRDSLGVWEGTMEFKDRAERILVLDRALANAKAPVTTAALTMPGQRGTTRPQSRLRVDSSDAILRDQGVGIFEQIRQNIGR